MSEIVDFLDGLSGAFASIPARIAVTLAAIAMVAAVSWIAHRVRSRVGDRVRGAIADLLVSTVVAVALVIASAIVIGVWGIAGTVVQAVDHAGLGTQAAVRLTLTVALFIGTFVFVGFLRRLIDELLGQHETVTEHQREVTYRVTQVALYITAGIIALGIWQVDLSGLLIGAGFLGIILGMAARQTLAAILAGFVLMFSRPFEIGDWIEVNDHEGTVTDITVINTRIQTFDGEYVILPNDVVSSETVINRSRKGRLRLRVTVGVDYETDLERAADVIDGAISDLDEILSVPTPQVVLTEFAESAIVFEVRFWIDRPSSRRRWRAKQAVIKAINEAFNREGIKIPYPQRELSGRAETGGFEVAMRGEATPDADETVPHADGGDRNE